MSGGNRSFNALLRGCLVGLVLAGLIWPSLAQEGKRGEQHPGRNQAESEQAPAQPPAAPAVSADRPLPEPDPKNYWDPCDNPKYGNESDLCQQWRMAEAAEESADWTLGQILATGVEALLLAIAIGIAWRASYWAKRAALAGAETVEEARAATKAAEDTVEVTRDIGIAQVRAYIAITKMVFYVLYDNKPHIEIEFSNAGQSPTRNIQVKIQFSIIDLSGGTQTYQSRELIHTMADVVPNQMNDITIVGFDISKDNPILIKENARQVLVSTIVEYIDVFNKNREDTFRHTIIYKPGAGFGRRQELIPEPRWMRNPQQPQT